MQKTIGIIGGLLVFILIALLPLDPVTFPFPAQRAAAVTGLMVIWWVTEAIPIYATALVPLVVFPLLGILSPTAAAVSYGNETVFLFMGGFFIAAAMVRWNLHRRIALSVIGLAGSGTKKLVLGFMVATAFLSMWISNTATAMMMIPIALALVSTLMPGVMTDTGANKTGSGSLPPASFSGSAMRQPSGEWRRLSGHRPMQSWSPRGSGIFPAAPGIDFFSWMTFAVPFMALFLLIAWFWLTFVTNRDMPGVISGSRDMIGDESKKLGPLTTVEKWTLLVFLFRCDSWDYQDTQGDRIARDPRDYHLYPGCHRCHHCHRWRGNLFMLPADAKNGSLYP